MSTYSSSDPHPIRLSPTQMLRAEHREIEEQLEALSSALRQIGDHGPVPEVLDRIESVARFIDSEMSVHHRKEEEGLFPYLEEFLASEHLHLDARIADHEDLKIMSGKFKDALNECRGAEPERKARFAAQMLRGYGLYIVHLVREHLLKEDQILFLVADEYLTGEQETEILGRFAAIEATES